MKANLNHVIILLLVGGALFGRYLLIPEQKSQPLENPKITKVFIPSSKKPQTVVTQKMDWVYPESAIEHAPIDEASLYAQLNDTLTAFRPDQPIQLFDLTGIAHCSRCLALLQNYLLTSNLTNKQLAQLANSLSRGNHPELATLLAETVAKMMHQSNDSKRNALLINALAKFNSAQVAKAFSSYLISDNKMPLPLRDALINNINETSNRFQVATDIVKQFNATNEVTVRDKLLNINHPEALAQIGSQALEQNNTELYNQTNEQLKSNPSKYALDALLSMSQINPTDTPQVNQVVESAYQLANRQFSGNRLDYIEQKLTQGAYSEQDKSLVLDILTHSEDQIRSSEIIAKFSN